MHPDRSLTESFTTQQRALDFCKWLSCLYEVGGSPRGASERYLDRWPRESSSADALAIITKSIATYEKAAVPPGDTVDPSWAGALHGVARLLDAFLALVRSASLIGRIPKLRMVPFHARVPVQTQAANYYWVQQGMTKPMTKLQFDAGITLGPTKAEGIIAVTRELMKLTTPGMESVLRDELVNGLTGFTDLSFLDPASATIPDARPGSVTNGTTPIPGTGDLRTDVGELVKQFSTGRPGATDAVLILSPGLAAQLVGVDGNPDSAYTMPLIKTEAAGVNVIALDPKGVAVADGTVRLDMSENAVAEMVDNPTGATGPTPFWQNNLVGIKTERFVNWQALPGAVRYLATT